jgi:hypothetical protein
MKGRATDWRNHKLTTYNRVGPGGTGNSYPTWEEFKTALTSQFRSDTALNDARFELEHVRPANKNRDIYELIEWVESKMAEAGVPEGEKENFILRALPDHSSTKIMEMGYNDYEDLKTKAYNIYRAQKKMGYIKRRITKDPDAMDVDAVQIDKRETECYNCGKKGHWMRECRLPKKQKEARFQANGITFQKWKGKGKGKGKSRSKGNFKSNRKSHGKAVRSAEIWEDQDSESESGTEESDEEPIDPESMGMTINAALKEYTPKERKKIMKSIQKGF